MSETTTRSTSGSVARLEKVRVPGLTILCHSETGRVGEQTTLPELLTGEAIRLSRHEPLFAPPRAGAPRSLDESHLSRQPIRLLRGEIRKTAASVGVRSGKSRLAGLRGDTNRPRTLQRAPRGRAPAGTELCSVIWLRVDLGRDRRGARSAPETSGRLAASPRLLPSLRLLGLLGLPSPRNLDHRDLTPFRPRFRLRDLARGRWRWYWRSWFPDEWQGGRIAALRKVPGRDQFTGQQGPRRLTVLELEYPEFAPELVAYLGTFCMEPRPR